MRTRLVALHSSLHLLRPLVNILSLPNRATFNRSRFFFSLAYYFYKEVFTLIGVRSYLQLAPVLPLVLYV